MKIKREVEVELTLTTADVATAFWNMSTDQQADFFNFLSKLAKKEDFIMQMQYLSENFFLDKNGRWIMNTIGEYAN